MLQSQVRKLSKILLERGREEGRLEGEQKGLQTVLLRQIEVKFGELDARTKSRVRAAGPQRLVEWAERVVTAERLSDVFAR